MAHLSAGVIIYPYLFNYAIYILKKYGKDNPQSRCNRYD